MISYKRAPTKRNPRILIVTPEITYLPGGMGNMANTLTAKAGGLADVSASLVSALFSIDVDVHVALPHYRRMFHIDVGKLINDELRVYKSKLPEDRIHLAEDRIFYYRDEVYSYGSEDNPGIALAFQREVINNIIPLVKPDLIHCNDWMTGLIPAAARRLNIPCLFIVHNIHTLKIMLDQIEDRGIDAAEFWMHLYYEHPPRNYEETRSHNPVNLLASGIFAAHFINTVSPTFLTEIVDGRHAFIPPEIRAEVAHKQHSGCAAGILNAPDPAFNPCEDRLIEQCYSGKNHVQGKRANKRCLQERLGLEINENAPLFFWPSRLDPVQKGCQLLTHILYDIVADYRAEGLQLVVIANGAYQQPFHDIVRFHDISDRVAVCDFREPLSHLGYAASDFMIMPSLFEPCGLPQMISCLYGSLPVVHRTGGLADTVEQLDIANNKGNGFVFETYDPYGLRWAIDRAVEFHRMPGKIHSGQVQRIMSESVERFTHNVTARGYFSIYERMLQRSLVDRF